MAYINGKEVLFSPVLSLIDGVDKELYEQVAESFAAVMQGESTAVVIPEGVTSIREYAFYRHPMTSVKVPSSVTSINRLAFGACGSCLRYDFTEHKTVPSLARVDGFDGINANAEIVVPDNLYSSWIAETNWANYASYIKSDLKTIAIPAEDVTEYTGGVGVENYVGIGFYFSDDLTAGKRYISRTYSDNGTEKTDVYEYSSNIYIPEDDVTIFTADGEWVGDNYNDGGVFLTGEFLVATMVFNLAGTYKIYQKYIDRSGKEFTTAAYVYEVS